MKREDGVQPEGPPKKKPDRPSKFLDFKVICTPLRSSDLDNRRSPKVRSGNDTRLESSAFRKSPANSETCFGAMMSMSTINVPRCQKRDFGPTGAAPKSRPLTSLSQPCLPVCLQGPTKILPFLYLGSQQDVMDQHTLKKFGIDFVLNLSTSCPKPDHLQDEHFLRIPVQDSYTEELLPYFEEAFQFLDKVREASGVALIHCLAGISRSPTLAIAYVMRYLHMSQDEAYRYVKEKRPSISPNFNFLGQLLEYERLLASTRSSRRASISLKSSPSAEWVKSPPSSSSIISRPSFLLPKSSLYPTLMEQSPDSNPRTLEEQTGHWIRSSQKLSAEDSGYFTSMHCSASDSILPHGEKWTKKISEIGCQWPTAQRVEKEILCHSPDVSGVQSTSTAINRSTLDLELDRVISGPLMPTHLNSKLFNLHKASELPSPSTELSKLNFDSRGQSSPSLRQPPEEVDDAYFSTGSVCVKKIDEKTCKINPLFLTDHSPIPPERRRKRTALGPGVVLMDCQEAGPSSRDYHSDCNSRRGGRKSDGFEAKDDERPMISICPPLDVQPNNQSLRNSSFVATNPLFNSQLSYDWQATAKAKPGPPCTKFKHILKSKSSGPMLMRRFIQSHRERKYAPNATEKDYS